MYPYTMPRENRNARINVPKSSGNNDYERHKLESDNVVNKSHWNTAKTRKTSQRIIESRFHTRRHWVPRRSELLVQHGDIDVDPFCVGVEVDEFELEIRSVLVIEQPPVDTNLPASISVMPL